MSQFLRTDAFLYIILGVNVLLFALYILTVMTSNKVKRQYNDFMKKLGSGTNIDEILKGQVYKIDGLTIRTNELEAYCKRIEQNLLQCIQKVGIVRYTAFRDVGSDLSFAVALLDEGNNGVVLNGIYSAEASNIYAKPIVNGNSSYKITVEERQAIDIAIAKTGSTKIIEDK